MDSTADEAQIALLVSTTRHARVGRQLADALIRGTAGTPGVRLRLVDLAEVGLPWLDEPRPPSAGDYQQPTTLAWAREVSSWDGVIILSAQYNGGYPAPLKNAIDTVYAEWAGKPTLIATYGGHRSGGGRSAGEQLRTVLQVTRNAVVDATVALELDGSDYGPELHLRDEDAIIARNRDQILAGLAELTTAIHHHDEEPQHER